MAFTAKALADGTLAAAAAAIYVVPAGSTVYVKSLTLFNTSASPQTAVLYLNRTGTAREWQQYILDQNEFAEAFENGGSVILEAGDIISAESTDAGVVTFTISGVVET